MDVDTLTKDQELLNALAALKGKRYSDIVDDAGLQYVDLVMEGGGMLGIALVGYTWALEQAGIRFLGIAGTSAGAINALLLAAMGKPAEAKSPKLLREMAKLDFFSFVDGDDDARDFIENAVKGAGRLKLIFKGAQVIDNLTERMGLNPGRKFQEWLEGLLKQEGIETLADLQHRMAQLPQGLRQVGGALLEPKKAGSSLAIVAADVSTETKVVFPDNAGLYFANPLTVNPALFVRASMSIPYFFEPLRIESIPQGQKAQAAWGDVGYDSQKEQGGLPKDALFVDGGIMSNFPIDIFHDYTGKPLAPTFGVKLQYDNRRHVIDGPLGLAGAIFNSARHCLDYEFLHRNPEYKRLVQWIPCQEYNWLDFNMGEESRAGLFKEGARKAIEFLQGFDWASYQAYRESMAESRKMLEGG